MSDVFKLCCHGILEYTCTDCPKRLQSLGLLTCMHGYSKGCRFCDSVSYGSRSKQPELPEIAFEFPDSSLLVSTPIMEMEPITEPITEPIVEIENTTKPVIDVKCVHDLSNTCDVCNTIAIHDCEYNKASNGVFYLDCVHKLITECIQCNAQRAERLSNDYASNLIANELLKGITHSTYEAIRHRVSKGPVRYKSRFKNQCIHGSRKMCAPCNTLQDAVIEAEYKTIYQQLNVVMDSVEPTNVRWNAVENRVCKHHSSNRTCDSCRIQVTYDSDFMSAFCGHNIIRKTCIMCCMNAKCIHGSPRRFCTTCFPPETVDALWKSNCKLVPMHTGEVTPKVSPKTSSKVTSQKRKARSTKPKGNSKKQTLSKSTTEEVHTSTAADVLCNMSSV
jgi:hypothetical protein